MKLTPGLFKQLKSFVPIYGKIYKAIKLYALKSLKIIYVFVVALAPTHINTIETPSNQKLGPEVATNFDFAERN